LLPYTELRHALVLRSMTNARPGPGFRTARMGQWTFTPSPVRFPDGAGGFLQRGSQRIPLRFSSPVLEDFVRDLGRIQASWNRLGWAD